ncbi:uncharacterized protein LOC127796776 isoform X2 [Diospyros lotus]|uniref:uncharacterized protein LOC127796776 isoform X2 n=1 Tax=Diospyros lotus TaxID=55363 RepID=UPI00224DE8F9|nr:uncharacterized protein LOC127796776 isoform X2 [Diospyros lotus]
MDFHSLARRELQALCKKNRIPANLTNVAMADALKALDIVEGIEELLNPTEGGTTVGSPCVPRTSCRSSTRVKSFQEPESSQVSTRTRSRTRGVVAEEMENANPDVPETPAIRSTRKRAPVGSVRRKMETQLKEEGEDTPAASTTRRAASVRPANSTRRMTRLLEKKLVELNLNDNEEMEAVQVDNSCEENPEDLGKGSAVKGTGEQNTSDDKTDESEAILDEKPDDKRSRNVRELVDNVQGCTEYKEESDELKVEPQKKSEECDECKERLTTEKEKGVDDVVCDVKKDDDTQTNSGVCEQGYGESAVFSSGTKVENVPEQKVEISDKEESDDSGFGTFPSDISSHTECLVLENGEEGSNSGEDLSSKDSATVVLDTSIGGDATGLVVAPQSPLQQENTQSLNEETVDGLGNENSAETENDVSDQNFSAPNENQKQDAELQNLSGQESDMYSESEEASDDDTETELEPYEVQDLESPIVLGDAKDTKGNTSSDDETVTSGEVSDQEVEELSSEDDCNSEESATIESGKEVATDDATVNGEEASDQEVQKLSSEDECNSAESVTEVSVEEKTFQNVMCNQLAVQDLPGPMSPSLLHAGLAHSVSMTPTASQKKINDIMDDKKENIDGNGQKLLLTIDKKKTATPLEHKSLRKLSKMLKSKLQITDGKINAKQVGGKARPALQTLPENQLAANEAAQA